MGRAGAGAPSVRWDVAVSPRRNWGPLGAGAEPQRGQGPDPAEGAHGLMEDLLPVDQEAQFSRARPSTLENSSVLLVMRISPRLLAWAAISRSLAPIKAPRPLRSERISA